MVRGMVLVALGAMAWTGAAQAGIKMTLNCDQNLSNGKIIVDGSMLPQGARYKVLQYVPEQKDDAWSHGRCQLDVTKGVSG